MGATVVQGDFEWDEEKALSNIQKHGVTFAVAATVFADDNAVLDSDDASGEELLTVIGMSIEGVLFVVFVERGERDRIISARSNPN
jgi:uncharacterized protein